MATIIKQVLFLLFLLLYTYSVFGTIIETTFTCLGSEQNNKWNIQQRSNSLVIQ